MLRTLVSKAARKVRLVGTPVPQGIRTSAGEDGTAKIDKGNGNPFVPPEEEMFIGPGDFAAIGDEFFNIFRNYGGLRSTDRVLDVGSGQGRMALPLTRFLVVPGSYTGIEIVKRGVAWCQNAYQDYLNFTFLHADIYNKTYNEEGRIQAREYQFPFPSESFDFIFLISVFTHMCPADVQHYLTEISRCLKHGGHCAITFFLLTPDSLRQIDAGNAKIPFKFTVFDKCMTTDADEPEAAIAYQEPLIREWFQAKYLQIVGDIYHGDWAHTEDGLTFQDVVIASKA
jgi:SAM-dependent methyltransferase